MPAISFHRGFLDALLSGDKQQTTRKQTDRIKVGDVCHIYIEQRSRIIDKPLRRLTADGVRVMTQKTVGGSFPYPPEFCTNKTYAHFLGKLRICEVSEIFPCRMPDNDLEAWAYRDGFRNLTDADVWFTDHYGEYWIDLKWTVIRWNGWAERYFKPDTK